MTIEPLKHKLNPLGPLAWATSVALLGVTKLQLGKDVNPDQILAIKEVAQKTRLLYRDCQIDSEDYLNGSLSPEGSQANPFIFELDPEDNGIFESLQEDNLFSVLNDFETIITLVSNGDNKNVPQTCLDNVSTFCLSFLSLCNSQTELAEYLPKH